MAPATDITVRLLKDDNATSVMGKVTPYLGQDYSKLLRECLQRGRLFEDPYFPAEPKSLGYNQLGPWSTDARGIQWKRPEEICQSPLFVCDNIKWTDVCQGKLGNCWFLAAVASLTLYPLLMQRVVPAQAKQYAGIFHFQFWQYGEWVDVVVDDRLPTKNGELVFVSSAEKREFWPALLEKAYAKLNGSYEALNGGFVNEAFVDFTGGVDESVNLKTPPLNLYKIIQTAVEKRSLMGASIKILNQNESEMRTPEGLVKGHAYSIIGVSEVEYNGRRIPLLRLRNPWGRVEWNGRWSDNSPMWSLLDNALLEKLHVSGEDGEFWMQMDDVLRYFDTLEICNLSPDSAGTDAPHSWNASSFHGRWVRGHNAGGCRNNRGSFWTNPQFLVTIEGKDEEHFCTLLASLIQKEGRKDRAIGRDFLAIGFEVYKVAKQFSPMSSVSQRMETASGLIPMILTPYVAKRDVTARYELPPGQYLIIPTTYMPHEESSFTLRVFTETENTLTEVDCEVKVRGQVFQESELQMNKEEFSRHFLRLSGQDQEMSPEELQSILLEVTAKKTHLKTDGFSLDTCTQLLRIADFSGTGKLQLEEFKYLWSKIKEWEYLFIKHDGDRSGTMDIQELRLVLEVAGFQLNNSLVESLCMKYGNDVRQVDFDSFLSCLAHLVGVFGKCRNMDQNKDGVISLGEQQEICQHPKFICEDMKWTDIRQGELGNCWFLAAAASLTLYPLLMERVVPPRQSFDKEYAGLFHFQFWQYGEWVDVVVDDRLPTKNGELVFVSSAEKSEFWPALLEKAYAKLNGSYEALNGGWVNEAFVDFTGGVDESVDLKTPPPNLYKIIQTAVEKRSLMGASINILNQNESEMRTPEGLVKGHAYSIIGVSEVEYNGRRILLLRLRNPWGKVEWNGRWSDNSPLWSQLDNTLWEKLHVKGEDGEFWMQMDDFLRYFDTLEICNLSPDSAGTDAPQPWNASSFHGKWVRGHNAGGCRNYRGTFWTNPQFLVTLEGGDEKSFCTLLASLLQEDRRKGRAIGRDFLVIGFEVYKVKYG
ncbi:calpain-2 catalytic subunit-like [Pseudophryne corroboree]|uniref:calpain-2 catalytic subunit-like n=1 Tax=Pseudophryne corroboree TaxID=495146 RepID=UPI003081F97A